MELVAGPGVGSSSYERRLGWDVRVRVGGRGERVGWERGGWRFIHYFIMTNGFFFVFFAFLVQWGRQMSGGERWPWAMCQGGQGDGTEGVGREESERRWCVSGEVGWMCGWQLGCHLGFVALLCPR